MDINQNELIAFPASELMKKCKCHEDIVNLCREMGNINLLTL